jgi:hypothetical protein
MLRNGLMALGIALLIGSQANAEGWKTVTSGFESENQIAAGTVTIDATIFGGGAAKLTVNGKTYDLTKQGNHFEYKHEGGQLKITVDGVGAPAWGGGSLIGGSELRWGKFKKDNADRYDLILNVRR